MPTTRRIELAKAMAADLRKREGRNLVAVGVYGSVARAEERRHSDVDLLVVVHRKRRGIRHAVHPGILVTILQQTPVESREEAIGPNPGMNDPPAGRGALRPPCD